MARGGGGGSHSSGRSSGGGHSGGSRSTSRSGGSGSFGGRGFSSPGRGGSVHTGSGGRGLGASPPPRGGHYGAPPPPPPRGRYGAPPPPPRGRYYRTYTRPVRRGGGCVGALALIILIMVLITAFMGMAGRNIFSGLSGTTKSDTKREKLDSSYVNYVNEWYDDQLGWIGKNNSTLINGLEDFYQYTGVQPYICLVEYGVVEDNDDARTDYIESLYDELFTDEGHLLFCYFACENDSPDWMDGTWQYIVGKATETVMDENAKDILESNFEHYYTDTSLDVDELFAKTFSAAGKSIMKGPIHLRYVVIIIVAIIAVVIIIILLIRWWKARAAQKNKEQEDLERMLDKPLETFGTDSVDDLKNKYDNNN